MDHLVVERRPELHDPVAIIAFAGWNDAASAATNAARFVVRRLGARKFAHMDPEDFFDFTDARPAVRIDSNQNRVISWPSCEFFYARNPLGPHDVIVAIGVEPHLRWRTFADAYASLFADLKASLIISVGALMADVPHTRPVRVTGTAIDPATGERLQLATSRYQGPTGIVGVLSDNLRQRDLPTASLWASVPHYITTAQNPPATIALLQRLQPLIGGLEFDFTELNGAAERFIREVNTALSGNPDILTYVSKLESAIDSGEPPETASALPPAGDLVTDIEEFLRNQKGND
jgi:proteasome assembly chaperone (PAC2) family protein